MPAHLQPMTSPQPHLAQWSTLGDHPGDDLSRRSGTVASKPASARRSRSAGPVLRRQSARLLSMASATDCDASAYASSRVSSQVLVDVVGVEQALRDVRSADSRPRRHRGSLNVPLVARANPGGATVATSQLAALNRVVGDGRALRRRTVRRRWRTRRAVTA